MVSEDFVPAILIQQSFADVSFKTVAKWQLYWKADVSVLLVLKSPQIQ